jgi:hypothetical protein
MKNKNKGTKKVDSERTELLKERQALNRRMKEGFININNFIGRVYTFGVKVGRAGYEADLKKVKV